ncbi:MAG: hypothetical protein M1820_005593 [Bogoriella megaspora]|nr:MAG: hypothetical protein M1820_005593 [Bogoriella megaspora]
MLGEESMDLCHINKVSYACGHTQIEGEDHYGHNPKTTPCRAQMNLGLSNNDELCQECGREVDTLLLDLLAQGINTGKGTALGRAVDYAIKVLKSKDAALAAIWREIMPPPPPPLIRNAAGSLWHDGKFCTVLGCRSCGDLIWAQVQESRQ